MSHSALITMILTQTFVTAITVYFFYKVLNTPNKEED